MSNHRDDDLEPALRAMLGDHHLDVHPRSDAVGTVLAGVGRARRRRTTAYAGASTLVLAGVLGVVLTSGDEPQSFQPIAPGSTESSTAMPTPSVPPTATSASPTDPTVPQTSSSAPPSVPVEPVVEMLRPDGIGDIVLGMPPADAYGTGTLGMYDPATGAVIPWDGSGADNICTTAGQAKRTTPDAALVWMDDSTGVTEIAIMAISNPEDLTVEGPEVQTVEGLRLFDDLDRVLELYPDARRNDSSPSSLAFFVDDWGGRGNVLKIQDQGTGTVWGMSVVVPGFGGCYE